jgi:hypothetical protein
MISETCDPERLTVGLISAKILHAHETEHLSCGCSSIGRTSPCQGEGRGFESHRPLFHLHGVVAKWEGKGLQNPHHGFKSRRRLF